jgi:hypothetical protein
VKHFSDGERDITHLPHRGQLRNAIMEWNEQKADVLITEDWRAMAREILVQLRIGQNGVQDMIKAKGYWKACCRWLPWLQMHDKKGHSWMCHHNCFNNMLSRMMTSYCMSWLLMTAGSNILTPTLNNMASSCISKERYADWN